MARAQAGWAARAYEGDLLDISSKNSQPKTIQPARAIWFGDQGCRHVRRRSPMAIPKKGSQAAKEISKTTR